MNLDKVIAGFFIILAMTVNFGFFYGDMESLEAHSKYELFAAIIVNIIATTLKLGDKTQMGSVLLATSLVADIDKGWNDILEKRDIKLIRRGDAKIEALQGDLHLQVYFYGYRKKRDTFLRTLNVKLDTPAEELCELMQLEKYR